MDEFLEGVASALDELSLQIAVRREMRAQDNIPIPLVWRKLPKGMIQRMTAKVRRAAA